MTTEDSIEVEGEVTEALPNTMFRVRPARWAASTFCLMPPTGITRPRSVTSPVMPTSERTLRPLSSEARAVVIVTPALGPSFGIAPAGTCTWKSRSAKSRESMSSSSACDRT